MGLIGVLFLSLLSIHLCRGIDTIKVELTTQQKHNTLFPLHTPKFTRLTDKPSHLTKLSPSQLGVLFSHLLGLNPSENLYWGGVTSSNFLFRPKAIALLTVDGMPENKPLSLPQETTSYQVVKGSSLSDWLRGAFNPSILRSRITELLGGQNEPLMVSTCSEEKIVSVGPRGLRMLRGYYNPSNKGVSEISDYVHTDITGKVFRRKMEQMEIDDSVTYSKETDTILVRKPDGAQILFNLKYEADLKFFTEIMVAMDTIRKMQDREETFDNVPDLISLSFTALKDLRLKYGDSSPQVSAAIQLYSSLLPKLTNQISALYDGQLAVFGLSLSWTNPSGHTLAPSVSDLYQLTLQHLQNQDMEHFQLNFPEIILKEESKHHIPTLCSQATKISERTQLLHISCPHRFRRGTTLLSNNQTDEIDPNSLTADTLLDLPYVFNIVLLVVILFALSLLAISWVMWFMDPGSDSVIYRMTQPAKLKTE